jgi:hypothetical protein
VSIGTPHLPSAKIEVLYHRTSRRGPRLRARLDFPSGATQGSLSRMSVISRCARAVTERSQTEPIAGRLRTSSSALAPEPSCERYRALQWCRCRAGSTLGCGLRRTVPAVERYRQIPPAELASRQLPTKREARASCSPLVGRKVEQDLQISAAGSVTGNGAGHDGATPGKRKCQKPGGLGRHLWDRRVPSVGARSRS